MTLRDRLLAAAHAHPGRPALWTEEAALPYEALFARAEALARRLDERLPAGVGLGVHADRGVASLAAILAAALSGRPYVPLNPSFPEERLRAVVAAARLGAILCAPETRAASERLVAGAGEPVLLLDERGEVVAGAPGEAARYEGTAYVMFTSGTTGAPKGVRVLERNVTAYLDGIAPVAGLTPEDRASQLFELSFDLSVHDLLVTWTAGAELVVLPRSRSMAAVAFARERGLTSWFSVPSLAAFCDRLGHLTPGALPGLRQALFCGEAFPVALARRVAAAAPQARVWNLYGPTEATIALTAYEVGRPDGLDGLAVVPLGRPIGEQTAEVDGEGEGELLLGGSQVTAGYVNAPDQNRERFVERGGDRLYRSGDLAAVAEPHGLLYRGRIDDQVKINGYRVELLEIDAALREAAGTAEAAAIPWPVSETGHADQIVGFICAPRATAAEIRRACRTRLAPYMVPRRVVALDRLPVNASGKIDRRALARLLDEERACASV